MNDGATAETPALVFFLFFFFTWGGDGGNFVYQREILV